METMIVKVAIPDPDKKFVLMEVDETGFALLKRLQDLNVLYGQVTKVEIERMC